MDRGTERHAKTVRWRFFLTISAVSGKIGPPAMFIRIVKDPMAELMRQLRDLTHPSALEQASNESHVTVL
jgi:hypothetical protein